MYPKQKASGINLTDSHSMWFPKRPLASITNTDRESPRLNERYSHPRWSSQGDTSQKMFLRLMHSRTIHLISDMMLGSAGEVVECWEQVMELTKHFWATPNTTSAFYPSADIEKKFYIYRNAVLNYWFLKYPAFVVVLLTHLVDALENTVQHPQGYLEAGKPQEQSEWATNSWYNWV